MELTPGFKLSEAGPIPDDWDAVALWRVAAKTRNAIVGGPFGSDLTAEDYRHEGVPVIRGSNMHGRQVRGPFVYVEAAKAKLLEANLARRGDIVFTQRGTLGQVALVPSDGYDAYLVSQSQMKASLDPALSDAEFVIHVFEQPEYQRKIVASAIQTGVPHLNLGILREYILPRPTLAEQREIAGVLGDVDAWIMSAEAEAAKLANVKVAAMDALLSPTTRLPGFPKKWKMRPLGDILTVRHGRSQHEVVERDGLYPIMATGGEIGRASAFLHPGPAVMIGRKGTIDFPQFCATPFWSIDTLFYCPAKADNDSLFAYYLFHMIDWPRFNEASGVPSLNSATIEQIELPIPEPTEQRAIAAVLTDIDKALAAARAVVAKAVCVKAAAMDVLLSGRIRLPLP